MFVHRCVVAHPINTARALPDTAKEWAILDLLRERSFGGWAAAPGGVTREGNMSGAQNWKGIDPKVREAAQQAAARQGLTLGEYLNQALSNHQPAPVAPRARRLSALQIEHEDDFDDWAIAPTSSRSNEAARVSQRLEAIERRTQLAVTGLDRAVSTIDRTLLGLAARVEEAEAISGEAATRIADALEQFRLAGDTLSGKLENEIEDVKSRLESQAAIADEVARRADAAASFLSSELENRDAALAETLTAARAVAEEAARQAAQASADAVQELRQLKNAMSERLVESESSTRRAVAEAIEEVRSETSTETRGTREALLEEVVRLESEIAKRVGLVEELRGEHSDLIQRIERAEHSARETTAGLRQAAGAAIADLRNAQLTLAARVKQVEDMAGGGGDVSGLRQQQQDIAERLAALETKTESSPVADALAAFERRLAGVEGGGKLDQVDGAVKSLDTAVQRLAERLAETETTASSAIRTLERLEQSAALHETDAVRAMLEQRLDGMAQSVQQMVGEARNELAGQLEAALNGDGAVESALTDVNRRLAAAERRQAQTIEAISLEIRRMSESVDKRLRAVEARNDDAAAAAVREELSRMVSTLEERFDEIERREAAAFDRMGIEVGRLSERLEERVGAVENRSAQAIEHVGEQVARMADRFNQRQDALSRELGERMLDSEERSSARVAEAISSIMERLAEVERNSADAIAPVQKAVSSVATKLDRYEHAHDADADTPDYIPSPARRAEDRGDDIVAFDDGDLYVSPMDAAQPARAGPLPPTRHTPPPFDDEIVEDASASIFEEPNEARADPLDWTPPPLPEAEDLITEDLDDDPFHARAGSAFEEDQSPATRDFWQPQDDPNKHVPLAPIEIEPVAPDEPLAAAVEPPPSKNDYLANARRAAQAQMQSPQRGGEAKPAPRLSLRGSSRIMLWGAASIVALAVIGGARYFADRNAETGTDAQTEPTPAAPEATSETPASDAATSPDASATPEAGAEAQPAAVAGPLAPTGATIEQAAQQGNLVAQYELALQRLAAGQTQEGVTLLRTAADRGFAMAQYRLAKLYERGEGVPADLTIARQWTERAAASGNRRAMHDLGVYFARGEGAPLDEAAAFRWFRQAAELGVADSQYNLGVLYQQGRGVTANASEALFWFLVAARQGDQDASARATALEAQLSQGQADQARARSQAFRPRAASAVANGDFGQRPWAPRQGA
jgi:localization factor PodJL